MSETVPEPPDPQQIQSGPILHETLSPELLAKVRVVYKIIGNYLDTTLEQFEIRFKQDAHPDDKVATWCCIRDAWIAYHNRYLNNKLLSDSKEKNLVAALITISEGYRDVDSLDVPAEIGRKLLACYNRVRQR